MKRFLIIALFAASCGVAPTEEATLAESALASENTMAGTVWSYYTGSTTVGRPPFTMYQPDRNCSPLGLGGSAHAYRIPSDPVTHACLPDTGGQISWSPYRFYATYEIWETHVPNIQMDWYATLAINYLCMAAYERAGYSYSQAYPYCSGASSSTVPTVRHLIHDTYFAGWPFWQ